MYDATQREALLEAWYHDVIHKVLHLKRYARQRYHYASLCGVKPHSWCCAVGIVQHRATLWHKSLCAV